MATTEFESSATMRLMRQLSMRAGFNVETLAAAFTMDSSSASFQKLDPGGAHRNVLLPPAPKSQGPIWIQNTADAAENLVVKNSAGTTTVATLGAGEAGIFGYDTEAAAWDIFFRVSSTGDTSISADTISEVTAAAGVTVDGCLIKDGRAGGLAVNQMFSSTEQTGTGGSQTVAHGLGSTPSLIWITVTEDPAGTGFDVAEGAHDVTNIVVTVTTGVKFRAYALK